ncbi:MAG: NAD(P)H-dependent oxidoreductase [Candidatus Paceibacterota bacterium]
MEKDFFIPLILGTNREGRQSECVARVIRKICEADSRVETKLFDVRDFDLPRSNYGQSIKESFPEYRDAIERCDGLIIVTPEYNHGYPGVLKSVLDLLLPEYKHKAVGLVGVSAGAWGGVRVLESLTVVVRELGLIVSSKDLNFPKVGDMFDEGGELNGELKEAVHERCEGFLEELIWLADALRAKRNTE